MFGLCGYHCVSHHLYLCPCSVCSVCDAYGACRISYGACRISCSVCRASCGVSNTCRAYMFMLLILYSSINNCSLILWNIVSIYAIHCRILIFNS